MGGEQSGGAESEEPSPDTLPFATQNTVAPHHLRRIGEDPFIRQCLHNPHLQQLLRDIDGSPNPSRSLDRAVQEPLFKEFEERCYDIITDTPDPPRVTGEDRLAQALATLLES